MTRRYQRKRDRFKVNLTKAAGLRHRRGVIRPCAILSPSIIGVASTTG
jgi:hypothetical protein